MQGWHPLRRSSRPRRRRAPLPSTHAAPSASLGVFRALFDEKWTSVLCLVSKSRTDSTHSLIPILIMLWPRFLVSFPWTPCFQNWPELCLSYCLVKSIWTETLETNCQSLMRAFPSVCFWLSFSPGPAGKLTKIPFCSCFSLLCSCGVSKFSLSEVSLAALSAVIHWEYTELWWCND